MQIFYDRIIAGIVLLLWATLVVVKKTTTGSLLRDRPPRGFWFWLTHIFNFFFLLVANPIAAVLLSYDRAQALDPTHLAIEPPELLISLKAAGMGLYAAGYFLMSWGLITLRGRYQVGGSAPRTSDELILHGPYRFIRHPMYTAALCISLGLACLTQSLIYLGVFCTYVLLMFLLIPVEEAGLRRAYGERYAVYERTVNRLIPFFY